MDPPAVDKPRRAGYGIAITSLMLLFLISSLAQTNLTFAQNQAADGLFPPTIIASSSTDTTPNSLKLLATQAEGAAVQEVSGFGLDTLDNITAQPDSQLLVFVSDSSVRIVGAKASTASGEIIDMVPSTSTSQQAANSFSLANLPAGVYILDILTQKGNTRGVYEGILEIGEQPTTTVAASSLSPTPPALPIPTPAASPAASPSDEQSENGENEDENGDEDNGDGDSGDEDSGDEDNEGTEGGGDEGGGDEGPQTP